MIHRFYTPFLYVVIYKTLCKKVVPYILSIFLSLFENDNKKILNSMIYIQTMPNKLAPCNNYEESVDREI